MTDVSAFRAGGTSGALLFLIIVPDPGILF